jgi:hypothetical protein
MTLILSVITPHFVIQASDRRVTTVQGEQVVNIDDDRNKAIFVADRLTFAMTGAADIDGDTIGFFAAQLSRNLSQGKPVEIALAEAGTMCGQYLAQRADRTSAFLAFVGVGWTDIPPAARSPIAMWTSNAMDDEGQWHPIPTCEFDTHTAALQEHELFRLLISGTRLEAEQIEQLNLDLVGIISAGDEPAPVADVLIDHVRAAALGNSAIGSGVMVNCIPFACGSSDGSIMILGGPPKPDIRTFTYVPAGQSTSIYLGPHFVGSEGSAMSEFQAQGGAPGTFGVGYGATQPEKQRRAVVGQRINTIEVGRNDPCWCGSGRKLKRCHGR